MKGLSSVRAREGALPGARTRSLIFLLVLLIFPATVFAWEIESFDADLAIQADGSVQVTETIRADFQGEDRHGIYRDIPLVTQDRMGVRRSIRLTYLGAKNNQGWPWPAQLSRLGVTQRIKLGFADVTYQGGETFQITYRVDRLLQVFPDHDELYWNATGNDWAVPIRAASATIHLPKPVQAVQLRAAATTGAYGSSANDARVEISDGKIRFEVSRSLGPFEGLTVVSGWPQGVVALPGTQKKWIWFLQDNWFFGIPILVLWVMGAIWYAFGRDLPKEPVAVQYAAPDGLTPAEVGALADDRVDLRDITATLLDLARRGYLTLEEIGSRDYILTRRGKGKSGDRSLKPHEESLLEALFSSADAVHLSQLENKFYRNLESIRSRLYSELVRKGYWRRSPAQIRKIWGGVALVVFVLAYFGTHTAPGPLLLSLLISAGIVWWFGRYMPRKTLQGARALEKILGFEEFLRRTDEDRIKRESDPAELFEQMLPYAMALGVANQWTKAFEGIYQVSPSWYIGHEGGTFTPADFTRRIDRAGSRMGAVLASAPRSSGGSGFGGGFSGGGGGGGGGGSW